MKRQIFVFFMALVLTAATGLMAQSGGGSGGGANSGAVSGGSGVPPTSTSTLPPSQQVDPSGQPEQTGRPDVDVDTGKNADNGVLNMDVKRNGDADTKAGNNPNGNQPNGNQMGTTTTGTTGTTTTTTSTGSYNGSTDTTSTSSDVSSSRSMPRTASNMPLVGLLGALALAGALGLRAAR